MILSSVLAASFATVIPIGVDGDYELEGHLDVWALPYGEWTVIIPTQYSTGGLGVRPAVTV